MEYNNSIIQGCNDSRFKDSRIQDSRIQGCKIQERVGYTLYKKGDEQCNIKNRYQSPYSIEKES